MTKPHVFGAPNLRQSKKFTQPLVVMVETFRMSVEAGDILTGAPTYRNFKENLFELLYVAILMLQKLHKQ